MRRERFDDMPGMRLVDRAGGRAVSEFDPCEEHCDPNGSACGAVTGPCLPGATGVR